MHSLRSQTGQAAAEGLGVLLLVALVTGALATSGTGDRIACEIGSEVDRIGGGDPGACAERAAAASARVAGDDDDDGGQDDDDGGGHDACLYMRALCELTPDLPSPLDLGDEETHDITFGTGTIYATVYENATGAILALYELCDEDIDCVIRELRNLNIGPQEGRGAAEWNDALDKPEELEEAIRELREQGGGCLALEADKRPIVGNGVHWDTRGSDGHACEDGIEIEQGEPGVVEVTLDADGVHVRIGADESGQLMLLYEFCGGDIACVRTILLDPPPQIADAAPELAEALEQLEADPISRELRDRALSESESEDMDAAWQEVQEQGGCLGIDMGVHEGNDGEIDWVRIAPGEPGCPA